MKTAICCFGPAKTTLYLLLIVFFTPKMIMNNVSHIQTGVIQVQ